MFTGLISAQGSIQGVAGRRGIRHVTVALSGSVWPDLQLGESVAIQGICLTVTAVLDRGRGFAVEAVPETCRSTTLGDWRPGTRVNLERALALQGKLEGHWVAGHVDGVGVVTAVRHLGRARRLQVRVPASLGRYLVPKGSVAVDGVSLTVAEVPAGDRFGVELIPQTLGSTTLGSARVGARVNIEADLLARYLDRLLAPAEQREGSFRQAVEQLFRSGE